MNELVMLHDYIKINLSVRHSLIIPTTDLCLMYNRPQLIFRYEKQGDILKYVWGVVSVYWDRLASVQKYTKLTRGMELWFTLTGNDRRRMNQSLDKNNNILQMVCESTKCFAWRSISSPINKHYLQNLCAETTVRSHVRPQTDLHFGLHPGHPQFDYENSQTVPKNNGQLFPSKSYHHHPQANSNRTLPNIPIWKKRRRTNLGASKQGKVHDKVSEPVGSATNWTISRKISKSDYQLRHVCPSAWNSVPTGRIFMKFEYFSKICRLNSSLSSDKQNGYCVWRPNVHFL
jgi:hypothetical protein